MTSYAEGFPSVDFPLTFASWSDIPSELLHAELLRRQESASRPACGSKSNKSAYNTPLHVAALVIILMLSVLACAFPIIVRRFPRLPVPHHFLFLSRHFGTGVLIATAFVHLLPTAFESLTDPCLPSFWNQGYPAMPGLIAMASVLIVVGIEMFFATRGAGHVHGSAYDSLPPQEYSDTRGHANGHGERRKKGHSREDSFRRFRQSMIGSRDGTTEVTFGHAAGSVEDLNATPSHNHAQSSHLAPRKHDDLEDDDSDMELSELDPMPDDGDSAGLLNGKSTQKAYAQDEDVDANETGGARSSTLTATQQQQKMLLQCLLLEAGILFHSVFIGMALSVATGTSFIVLLVAISFHQTFEGLALGSRIAALAFPTDSVKPWLMALAYGVTTPIGQAIGLAIHTLYDPASQTGLLTVGVMNAISSGLLLFAGLVELLAEDFLSDESYRTLKGRTRLEACASVVAGSALMALVGAWA